MADLRAILRLIESGALHEAAEVVDCLDTLVRETRSPSVSTTRSFQELDELSTLARQTRSLELQTVDAPRQEGGPDSGAIRVRPHQSLDGNSPTPGEVEPLDQGCVVAEPVLGSLHHRYRRTATIGCETVLFWRGLEALWVICHMSHMTDDHFLLDPL